MSNTKRKYKNALNVTGAVLLIFFALLDIFMSAYVMIDVAVYELLNPLAAEIISSIVYDVAYLASFMVPAFFMYLIKRRDMQPMRLKGGVTPISFALIATGVTCVFAFSYINSIVVSFLPTGGMDELFPQHMEDSSLILQFITIAIVPAFCEEFLFRGVILSNLMPYGKSTAIIVSAVCFGLMHGNFAQFLYATAAGIILGAVYVMTDSIWPSTFIHLINNALSVLNLALFDRMGEDAANICWIVVYSAIFVFGIIGAVAIIKKYKPSGKTPASVFGRDIDPCSESSDAEFGGNKKIKAADAPKLLFAPFMLAFIVISVGKAILVLFVM